MCDMMESGRRKQKYTPNSGPPPVSSVTYFMVSLLWMSRFVEVGCLLDMAFVSLDNGQRCYYEPSEGGGVCFLVGGVPYKSWFDAADICVSYGGHLLDKPGGTTTEVANQVMSMTEAADVWVQMTRVGTPWTWVSRGGASNINDLWALGQPTQAEAGSFCAQLDLKANYKLVAAPCHVTAGYICQIDVNSDLCQRRGSLFTEVVVHNDTCYMFMDASRDQSQNVTWFTARASCEMFDRNAQLAKIDNGVYRKIVKASPGKGMGVIGYWTGLTNAKWISAIGLTVDILVIGGLPPNSCVAMAKSVSREPSLVAKDCHVAANYMCEIEISKLVQPQETTEHPVGSASNSPDVMTLAEATTRKLTTPERSTEGSNTSAKDVTSATDSSDDRTKTTSKTPGFKLNMTSPLLTLTKTPVPTTQPLSTRWMCETSFTISFLLTITIKINGETPSSNGNIISMLINNVSNTLSSRAASACFNVTVASLDPGSQQNITVSPDQPTNDRPNIYVIFSMCNPESLQRFRNLDRKKDSYRILVCIGTMKDLSHPGNKEILKSFGTVIRADDISQLGDISANLSANVLEHYNAEGNSRENTNTKTFADTQTHTPTTVHLSVTSSAPDIPVINGTTQETSPTFIAIVISLPCSCMALIILIVIVMASRQRHLRKKEANKNIPDRGSRGNPRFDKYHSKTVPKVKRSKKGVVKLKPPRPGPPKTENAPNHLFYNCWTVSLNEKT